MNGLEYCTSLTNISATMYFVGIHGDNFMEWIVDRKDRRLRGRSRSWERGYVRQWSMSMLWTMPWLKLTLWWLLKNIPPTLPRDIYIDSYLSNYSRRPTQSNNFFFVVASAQLLNSYNKICTYLCPRMYSIHGHTGLHCDQPQSTRTWSKVRRDGCDASSILLSFHFVLLFACLQMISVVEFHKGLTVSIGMVSSLILGLPSLYQTTPVVVLHIAIGFTFKLGQFIFVISFSLHTVPVNLWLSLYSTYL